MIDLSKSGETWSGKHVFWLGVPTTASWRHKPKHSTMNAVTHRPRFVDLHQDVTQRNVSPAQFQPPPQQNERYSLLPARRRLEAHVAHRYGNDERHEARESSNRSARRRHGAAQQQLHLVAVSPGRYRLPPPRAAPPVVVSPTDVRVMVSMASLSEVTRSVGI